MVGTPLWWGVQFVLNFLDFAMVYIVAHAMVRRYIKVKPMHVLFCIAYTVALAPVFYFFGGHGFRVVVYGGMLLVIMMVTKRNNLGDVVVIWAIYYAIATIIQLPVLAIVRLAHNNRIWLEFPLDFLVAQCIAAIFIFLICRTLKLNQWFNAVMRNVVLKAVLLVAILIFTTVANILNFGYGLIALLSLVIIIAIIGLPLLFALRKIYYNAIGIISVHDLKNSLLALGIAMEGIDDIETLKNQVRSISKEFGMDLSQLENYEGKLEKSIEHRDIMTGRVNKFIDSKIKASGNKIKIIANVSYKKNYEDVEFALILRWLGTLLDNAIEATATNPIYIYIGASTDFLTIRTENEYIGDGGQDIKVILEEGYSTKDEGSGMGLYSLNQQVIEKGGRVELEEYYIEDLNCHYLQISVLFNKDFFAN